MNHWPAHRAGVACSSHEVTSERRRHHDADVRVHEPGRVPLARDRGLAAPSLLIAPKPDASRSAQGRATHLRTERHPVTSIDYLFASTCNPASRGEEETVRH